MRIVSAIRPGFPCEAGWPANPAATLSLRRRVAEGILWLALVLGWAARPAVLPGAPEKPASADIGVAMSSGPEAHGEDALRLAGRQQEAGDEGRAGDDGTSRTPSAKGGIGGADTDDATTRQAPAPQAQPATAQRNAIRVAHDLHYPPYEYVDDEGKSQGFGMDVIHEAAKRLGLGVEFVPMAWSEVLRKLRAGQVDLTPEMMHSEDRKLDWYLGQPWGETSSVVFVLQESAYMRMKDLWGRRIAVPAGDIEQEKLASLRAFKLEVTTNTRAALQLLDRGQVQAVACNRDVALFELTQSPIPLGRMRVLDDPLAVTPYSVAGRREKKYLIDSLTEAIQQMKQDGTFEALHWKWFLRPSDESIRIREHQEMLRRATLGVLIFSAVLLALGFVYYRRQKHRLEKLVRKRTRELTLSERHYRALFDHARDAIFLLNPDDRKITEVNPSAEHLTGRLRRRLLGRPIDDLFPPRERPKARRLFDQQSREETGSLLADIVLERPDHTRVVVQARGALVKLKEGTTLYAVFRDVTETAQARVQLEQINNELRIQNSLAFALQHDLPLGQRLGLGLDAILGLAEFQIRRRGAIFVLDPGADDLVLASIRGLDTLISIEDTEQSDDKSLRPARLCSPAGHFRGAMNGDMVVVASCRGELFPESSSAGLDEHGHYLCPLRSEGRILGVLCLFTEPHASADERRRILIEGLCTQIGLVIESETREHALRDREHRLESLYEIAISLGSSLQLTEQLRVLFAQIRRVMPADAGNVWVSDAEVFSDTAEVYYSYDTAEDGSLVEIPQRQQGRAVPGTFIHRVFMTGEPVLILRSEEDMKTLEAGSATQFGLERWSRSLLYVPLKFQGRVIGVLTVQSYAPFAYTQETVDVLMSLSAPLAAVIENARLFEAVEERRAELDQSLKMIEADLKAAQVAQESLLPREFPDVEGWGFASVFIPSQYVGGDIYNIFQFDERHFGLYHIDVSGHGVPAALFSVGLNQYLMRDLLGPGVLRGAGERPGQLVIRSPEEVIAALDRENMFQKHQRFFTMLYLVADVENGRIRFYRAGHNEPLLLRKGQPPQYLSGGGPLIGFQLPRKRKELQEVQLQPGDRLIIYSDGINEAINEKGDLYGLDRMARFLARGDGAAFQATFDSLVEDVRRFTHSQNFEDDVSMLGLAWNPPAPARPAARPRHADNPL